MSVSKDFGFDFPVIETPLFIYLVYLGIVSTICLVADLALLIGRRGATVKLRMIVLMP